MSKKIDITNKVMQEIRSGSVKMKPRIYFVAGSLFMAAGLVASFIVSVFLITLTRFSLRTHGPMGQYRLNEIMTSFPWWAPVVALAGIITGIILLKKYEFSYKKNFVVIILLFILAVFATGYAIDLLGLDDVWFRQGPMRGIMKQYIQDNGVLPEGMMRRGGRGLRWSK